MRFNDDAPVTWWATTDDEGDYEIEDDQEADSYTDEDKGDDFICKECDNEFVGFADDEDLACPECGSTDLELA